MAIMVVKARDLMVVKAREARDNFSNMPYPYNIVMMIGIDRRDHKLLSVAEARVARGNYQPW